MKDNEEKVKKNEQEKYDVEQANIKKLKDLTDNLNALNKGRASAEQMVGESNEDYLLRLQNIETTPYSVDELRDLANIKNIGTTKQNLKSFFSDDGRTSTIAKMLSPDEKFMFNKLFLKIKKKYLETYGFDNKQISNQDVVDFINKIEDQPIVQVVAAQAVPALLPAPAPAPIPPPVLLPKPPPPPTPKVKSIAAPLSPDDAELATKYPGPPASGLKLWASDNGILEVKPRMNIDEVIDTLFKKQIPVPEYFISRFHGEIAKAQARTNNQILMAVSGSGLKINKKSKAAIQGVNVRDIPPLMKFGKVYITADQLYFNNLLGIRNKSNRQVTGIPNVMVSDTLVHLLFKILDGGSLTKSDLSILKPSEKVVYDKLMKLSGLHKTMINSVDESLSEMKKRLELISGEIEAGNNNKELLKEAHGILFSMAQMNVITHVAANQYYKDLKSYF